MTAVIEASSAGVKDMADGSLRITFEFEPRHAAEAFALFGPRGRAVAIAALKDGAAAIPSNPGVLEKPKGGEWAKLAGMWCEDPHFYDWINSTTHAGVSWHVHNDMGAAAFVREMCEIDSRALLDHNKQAWIRFDNLIRRPYMQFMQDRRIK